MLTFLPRHQQTRCWVELRVRAGVVCRAQQVHVHIVYRWVSFFLPPNLPLLFCIRPNLDYVRLIHHSSFILPRSHHVVNLIAGELTAVGASVRSSIKHQLSTRSFIQRKPGATGLGYGTARAAAAAHTTRTSSRLIYGSRCCCAFLSPRCLLLAWSSSWVNGWSCWF